MMINKQQVGVYVRWLHVVHIYIVMNIHIYIYTIQSRMFYGHLYEQTKKLNL